jgi:hypothetical protein
MFLTSNVRVVTRRRPSVREDDNRRCLVISNSGLAMGIRWNSMVPCGRDVTEGERRALRSRIPLRDSRAGHALLLRGMTTATLCGLSTDIGYVFSCVILLVVNANFDAFHA